MHVVILVEFACGFFVGDKSKILDVSIERIGSVVRDPSLVSGAVCGGYWAYNHRLAVAFEPSLSEARQSSLFCLGTCTIWDRLALLCESSSSCRICGEIGPVNLSLG